MAVDTPARFAPARILRSVFGVVADRRTYKNLVYLLLFFPIGLAYFVVFVTFGAIGVAFALSIVLLPIGILVLLPFPYVTLGLTWFERKLASVLVDVEFDGPAIPRDGEPIQRLSRYPDDADFEEVLSAVTTNYAACLSCLRTWTGTVHHLGKFFVGVALFTLLVAVFLNVLLMLFVPWTYESGLIAIHVPETITLSPSVIYDAGQYDVELTVPVTITSWVVDSFADAVLLSGVGALLFVVSLHLTNLLAWCTRWYARLLLR